MAVKQVDSANSSSPPVVGLRYLWLPLVGLMSAVVMIGALWLLPIDSLDSGLKLLVSAVISLLALLDVLIWFFLLSGAGRAIRRAGAVALVLLLAFLAFSVRGVEFSGDMVPTFRFAWSPDRMAVLEEHRARQRAADAAAPEDAQPVERQTTSAVVTQGAPGVDVLDFRGPRRDGIMAGPRLARDWSVEPPRLVWRQPVGGGYASFVVAGHLVITIEQRRDKEAVVAYDFNTGREHWVFDYPALFSERLGGDGPRATPVIHDGRVLALGATGILHCLELASGRKLWGGFNILEMNGAGNLEWGMASTPLVHEGLVIVNPGDQKGTPDSRSLLAFGIETGEPLRWSSGTGKASYASPMLVTLGGVGQVVVFDGVGLAGYDATPGEISDDKAGGYPLLWRLDWKSEFDINSSQPVVVDEDRLMITSGAGAALVQIARDGDKWSASEVWKNRKLKASYSSPIAYQGYVFGLDENILTCLDLANGKPRWKDRAGQYGHGQMLLRDDLLLILSESGELAMVEATPDQFHELGRIPAIEGKTWNNPTLAGRRIFVRNHLEMAAYDLPLESAEQVAQRP